MKLTDGECRSLIEKAVADERSACCRAVCHACARGDDLLPGGLHYRRERTGAPGQRLIRCKAAAIRLKGAV